MTFKFLPAALLVAVGACGDNEGPTAVARKNPAVAFSAYTVGTLTDIGSLSSSAYTDPRGINSAAEIVGVGRVADTYHAFRWQNGTMSDLGTLPGGNYSAALGINSVGLIVGEATTSESAYHAVIWENGTIYDLGTLPGEAYSAALDVNDQGQVIGISGSRGFVWQNGVMTALGILSGYDACDARRINAVGQIVGACYSSSGIRAVLWQNGAVIELAGPSGRNDCFANGINGSSQIVGSCYLSNGGRIAVLWQNGVASELSTLAPGNDAWANDINDAGQIVGGNDVPNVPASNAVAWQQGTITDLGWLPGSRASEAKRINSAGYATGVSLAFDILDGGSPTPPRVFGTLWAPAALQNTAPGANVLVQPIDATTGDPSPISLTFSNVIGGGTTTVTSGSVGGGSGPPPPTGFRLGSPNVYYDITTTATFSGAVTVCISYAGTAFQNQSQLKLLHGDGSGSWIDVTTSRDLEHKIICGSVTSLSPFVVAEDPYVFTGFFKPIENMDGSGNYILNQVKAGAAVPVKFSLGGSFGLDIFAAGYPKSATIACDPGASVGLVEGTLAAGQSSLSYDATSGQYTYTWKTDKSWSSCRQLIVRLNTGQEHRVNFRFTK